MAVIRVLTFLLLLVLAAGSAPAGAADALSGASTEALQKTIQLLNNPPKRSKEMGKDANTAWLDQQVRSLGGSKENSEAIYELSGEERSQVVR